MVAAGIKCTRWQSKGTVNMMDQAQSLLKEVFGYDEFRPRQAEIIRAVLDKKDAMVVMPTGGGKSICYQIPALIFGGLTVVISPLISLMKDQVEQLVQTGVDAAFLNSSLSSGRVSDQCPADQTGVR